MSNLRHVRYDRGHIPEYISSYATDIFHQHFRVDDLSDDYDYWTTLSQFAAILTRDLETSYSVEYLYNIFSIASLYITSDFQVVITNDLSFEISEENLAALILKYS